MKCTAKIVSILMLAVMALGIAGCSRFFGPSDEEILKAVNESGRLNNKAVFTVISPVVIVEKGKQSKDGSWPVIVKLRISYTKHRDGDPNSEQEIDPTFKIYKVKDSQGNSIWKAQ